jgi:hypothetical protein
MHVQVKELIPALRDALASVRYGGADVRVEAAERVDSYSEGGTGSRGFCIVVNLDTGARERIVGSWGGGNMFVRSLVDSGSERVELPPNGALVKGTMGYPRTFATIYAHPAAVGRFLPSGEEEELSAEEQNAMFCFVGLKGGAYRREELSRRRVSDSTVESLISRGYLKRNRAGATQATTKGKNAPRVRY